MVKTMRLMNLLNLLSLLFIFGCSASSGHGEKAFRPTSYSELKFYGTVRQRYDFSCGAASVATIFSNYFGEKVGEVDVLEALKATYVGGDFKQTVDLGFSFYDLILAVRHLGYEAQAAEIKYDQLKRLSGPVIIHLDKGKFQHFVVLRKVGNGVIYVADPLIGDIVMPEHEFRKQYTEYALGIWKNGKGLPPFSRLTAVKDGLSVSVSANSPMPLIPNNYPLM